MITQLWCACLLGLLSVATGPQRVSAVVDVSTRKVARIKPPIFSDVFYLKYTFSMPHFYLTQPNGLSYPVSVWYDGPNNLRRVEAYDGEDSCVSVGGIDYTVIPRINQLHCDVWGEPGRKVFSPLPDLYNWEYGGTVSLNGQDADIWQRQIKDYNKVSQYTFYVTPSGVPLRLSMIGINYLTNAHFDEYLYDFTQFEVGLANVNTTALFSVPPVCEQSLWEAELQSQQQQQRQEGEAERGQQPHQQELREEELREMEEGGLVSVQAGQPPRRQHPRAWQLAALLPDIRAYDDNHAYNIWSRAHGRVHDDADEYDARLERFRTIVQKIKEHNGRPDRSYTMRLNHWADWYDHEFSATMLPNLAGQPAQQQRQGGEEGEEDVLLSERSSPAYRPLGRLGSTLERRKLPVSVDWRGTGADPGIKDQGMCGSCYAFAATGAMDGAWYVATGQRRSFSEQQIVDCAWDYGPNGCFGGYYQPVFNFVAENGGIALEHDYSYRGEVGWCRSANHSLVGRFSGYWAVESRNELALMEAVWKYGPISVSVDAAPESFRFYSEGVYKEPTCSSKMRHLDHTVVLFGYGTTPEGEDYWLVRNSWAKFYGDDGYIRIVRGPQDCGIATDPAVPVVPEHLVDPTAREAARMEAARWQ